MQTLGQFSVQFNTEGFYLPVNVLYYDNGHDATDGGLTANHDHRFVIPHLDGFLSKANVEQNGYYILDIWCRVIGDKHFANAKPRCVEAETMMGGNFVYSSDARFRDVNRYPIPVHDRVKC
jgi:hypothetical protein